MTTVGIAGLGRMGSIFAARLIDAGVPVTVWNRTAAKADAFGRRGASLAATPAQLAGDCGIVLTSMADENALEAVFDGPDGLLSVDLTDRVIAETSTVMPDFARDLARRVAASGGAMVDAPVLGTVGPARAGQITVVAGGAKAAVERVRPLFGHLSRSFFHMGASGTGATMKLVVIMHLCTYWQSLSEALRMGGSEGLSGDAMLEVLLDSPVATSALAVKMPLIRGESEEVGYDIGGVCDVLRRSLHLADQRQVAAPASHSAMDSFSAIAASGREDRDVIQLVLDALGKR